MVLSVRWRKKIEVLLELEVKLVEVCLEVEEEVICLPNEDFEVQ